MECGSLLPLWVMAACCRRGACAQPKALQNSRHTERQPIGPQQAASPQRQQGCTQSTAAAPLLRAAPGMVWRRAKHCGVRQQGCTLTRSLPLVSPFGAGYASLSRPAFGPRLSTAAAPLLKAAPGMVWRRAENCGVRQPGLTMGSAKIFMGKTRENPGLTAGRDGRGLMFCRVGLY